MSEDCVDPWLRGADIAEKGRNAVFPQLSGCVLGPREAGHCMAIRADGSGHSRPNEAASTEDKDVHGVSFHGFSQRRSSGGLEVKGRYERGNGETPQGEPATSGIG